tara:strand:+ start:262 stop:441 length:180 start_codon:yes stop_codon:yes gene_type:complete
MDLQISPELIRNLFNYFIMFYWFSAPIVFIWYLFADDPEETLNKPIWEVFNKEGSNIND